ncbi:hypothetical protein E2I00_003724, partial [Balaenoptera physalus]
MVAAFKVATPYSLYVCPEGQNVTLTCRLLGPLAKGHDVTFYKTWYRSSRGEVQACSERRPIRNLTFQDLHLHHSGHQANTSQELAQRHGLESASDHHGNFTITMRNLTLLDGGLYCCLVAKKHHPSASCTHPPPRRVKQQMDQPGTKLEHTAGSELDPHGTKNKPLFLHTAELMPLVLEVCRLQLWWSFGTKAEVVSDEEKPGYAFGWGVRALDSASVLRVSEQPVTQGGRAVPSITAAALATSACIVGILCLPLILLLVYKQRQVASNHSREAAVGIMATEVTWDMPGVWPQGRGRVARSGAVGRQVGDRVDGSVCGAQELVRMDSNNTQGIENPGFEISPPSHGMPETKPRQPLTYVARRQPSESGRHLLSEPNTPLSPPGPGDVFFPSL